MNDNFNPFLLAGYINKELYCNREVELQTIDEHIVNGRNLVLFSWRRLGKTSLIKRYITEEQRSGNAKTIYMDLMATSNTKDAVETLIEGIYEKFGAIKTGMSTSFSKLIGSLGMSISFDANTGSPDFSLNLNPNFSPKLSLNEIGRFLEKQNSNIIIAIDEFQQIGNYKDDNAEAVFRNFMQSFPKLRFIFSGSHRHMMTSMFMEANRPFYRSCQMLSLEPIELTEYTKFIQKQFKKSGRKISTKIIETTYDWARGQTYCIQLVCNRLYARYSTINDASFREVTQSILSEEAAIFGNYFNLVPENQWDLMKAIAKEDGVQNPSAKDFINKHRLSAPSTVNSALKSIMKKEMVVKDGKEFIVHDIIFSRWLAQR